MIRHGAGRDRWSDPADAVGSMLATSTRPGGFPFLDTRGGVTRLFLERAPFNEQENAAIGSGNR
ncbi:MAG TPA: hypothetical protein VGN81_41465 [Pseudonocardiaceae bacterium]